MKETIKRNPPFSVSFWWKDNPIYAEVYLIDALITLGHLKKEKDLFRMADKILSNNKNIKGVTVDIFLKMCDFYESEGNKQKFLYFQTLMYRKLKEGYSNGCVW